MKRKRKIYRKMCLCLAVIILSAAAATAEEEKTNKLSDIVTGAVETTKKVTKGTLSTAVKVTKKTVSTAKNITKKTVSKAKELSGMSIVGNDEAPKSLYIVPWKSSELGVETSMNMMLNEADVPVDKDVFKREVDFYNISTRH